MTASEPDSPSSRWQEAQRYEAGYWKKVAQRLAQDESRQLDWYGWRAERLRRLLREVGLDHLTDGEARVLEIGSGPVGVTAFYPGKRRVALDPLEGFYRSDPLLTELRDPEVEYREGVGEDLPFDDASFSLIIIENCIDHVSDVDAVMAEIARVVRDQGALFLTVNCRTSWGYWVHRLLSRLRIDPGHPHTFTANRIQELVRRYGFELLHFDVDSFWDAWWEDLRGAGPKDWLKAVLGVSHFTAHLVARAR